jgi:hypothetical protein
VIIRVEGVGIFEIKEPVHINRLAAIFTVLADMPLRIEELSALGSTGSARGNDASTFGGTFDGEVLT